MSRILLVEDEEAIAKPVKLNLELDDYEVVHTKNVTEAMKAYKNQHFDLIILDLMLPGINGLDFCKDVRLRDREIPILILSAKSNPQERVEGLKMGADDYLTKPFSMEELGLRIENLLKRKTPDNTEEKDIYRFKDMTIYFDTYTVHGHNGEIVLTQKEALLLKLFAQNPNKVISREEILKSVWGYDVFPSTRTIDNFILAFRKYFEADPKNPTIFRSVRGVGYKFVQPKADA